MAAKVEAFAIFNPIQRVRRPAEKGISRYGSMTALAGGLAATILLAVPAAAQSTHGGHGGAGSSAATPPAGGTSSNTGAGQDGASVAIQFQGGAGGGAGVTGGNGGAATGPLAGGTGGASAGADGSAGGSSYYASGGGGGAHGAVLATTSTPGTDITGGSGGAGGIASGGDGGGGGGGGFGIVADTSGSFTFTHAISGGTGGAGGDGYFYGGGGGGGGHALVFTGSAAATINGAVTGGNGGARGINTSGVGAVGLFGAGGIGIVGSDIALTLNAAVSGGLSGDGFTRAYALNLSGNSSLTLGTGWSLAGGVNIASGNLTLSQSSAESLTSIISGAGNLVKDGAGTLTLDAVNTYGGTTTINAGTLELGASGGFGTGDIFVHSGTLRSATTRTISNRIYFDSFAATPSVQVGDGQTLTLDGFQEFNSGLITFGTAGEAGIIILAPSGSSFNPNAEIFVAGGTLRGGGSNFSVVAGGVLSVTVDAGATLDFNGRSDGQVRNLLGAGTLTNDGGVTTIAAGNFSGTIAGSQSIVLGDTDFATADTLTLTGSNTYSGGTTVNGGTLALGSDDAASTGSITLANNAILLNAACGCGTLTLGNAIDIVSGGTATIDSGGGETWLTGTISGGNLAFTNGLTVLTNTNSYGATAIDVSAGLQIGDDDATGTLGTGDVIVDGLLTFNRSDDITYSGAISGDGILQQDGSGTLTLTGTNSYTGGTIITDGTLQIGDGGTAGTLGTGEIANDGVLVFNRSDDISVSDAIYGGGDITKLGAGVLTLGGTNSYSGTTSIQGGTVAVSQFGLGASLVKIGNGAQVRAIEDAYVGDMAILSTGGVVDTGSHVFEVIGAVDFQGELTKIGSGTLILGDVNEEGVGSGGINVTAGTLGLGSDYAAGSGTIKLADGTTLLNAACGCYNLNIDNAIEVATAGTVTIDGDGANFNLNGTISGGDVRFFTSSSAPFAGSIFELNGANSYGDTLIGANVAVIVYDGTLGTGNVAFDSASSDPTTPAALAFQNGTDYSYSGTISGAGIVAVEADPGVTVTLTGSNTSTANFTGLVDVISGRLVIDGDFGDVTGNTATLMLDGGGGGPTLGGSGTFHGSIDFGNATINPGNSPGTLNIAGNLTLGLATILNFELGAPGTIGGASNDLINVGGDLTLNGTLNTIAFGLDYGPGYYRLINYGGTLTDNGLDIGSIDSGLAANVTTNIAGQVNLRLGGPQILQYWDGIDQTGASDATTGDGGAGTWNAAITNWTAPAGYAINDGWRGQAAVFAGATGGTVTVEGTQQFEELRFETDNYLLRPADALARLETTGGFSIVDVGAGLTTDIGVIIQGAGGLNKTGDGTLLLSAASSYTGATDVAAGTLRLGVNSALTDPTGLTVSAGATFDLNGFQTHVGSLAGAGDVTLGGGRLDIGYNNSSTIFSGTVTGADGSESTFTKNGGGTLMLSGTVALGNGGGLLRSFSQVNAGTLQITGTGSLSADLIQNFSTIENSGTINAYSTLQTFSTLTNNATGVIIGNTQNFSTLDNYGTMGGLQSLGGTATNYSTGVIDGNVQTFANFTSTGIINGSISNFSTAVIQNQVNGDIANLQAGASVTLIGTVTGITNYHGADGSIFDLAGFNTTVGGLTGTGSILLGGGALSVGDANDRAFNGVISGNGDFIKIGTGTQTLNGVHTYVGTTTVSAGTLEIGYGGSVTSDIAIATGAVLRNSGTVTGGVTNDGAFYSSATLTSSGPITLQNNSGATAYASGAIDGIVENAGTFNVTGALTGITDFNQAAGGALNLQGNVLTVGTLMGAGAVDLASGTLSIGAGDLSSNFTGTITGSGGIIKIGTGTFGLHGANNYTGQTIVSAGSLTLAGTGTIAGEVINNATFASLGIMGGGFTNNGMAQIGGELTGLVQNQTGTITLVTTTTGIGRIEQAAGAQFRLSSFNTEIGSLSGDGNMVLGSGQLTLGGDNSDASFAGVITGGGASRLIKVGAGTLTLSGASTYAGATVIAGGALLLADGGSIAGGDVMNDATLAFDGSVDRAFANAVQGNGVVSKTGANILTLTGANSYAGGTIVSGGVLALGDDQAAGTGAIALADGTTLRNASALPSLFLANDITGATGGTVTIDGGVNSRTFLSGGINGGNVAFAALGGPALFVLNGANSYDDTLIGGNVTLGIADSNLGDGNVIFDSAASDPLTLASLIFANSADYTYAGTISGGGLIEIQTNSNVTTTLSGSNGAGANYTGAIIVGSGKLAIDGDFGDVVGNSAELYLNDGGCGCTIASLGGSGTFHGDVTVLSGALSPGNSPGTLNIAGNLTLGGGTILNFELGEAGTVGGVNNDLVIVGGNLTLDGTLNITALPTFGSGYYRLFTYGGALIDNGLAYGSLPAGYTSTLLTDIAGQVNILFADGVQAIQYWDGADTNGASTGAGGDGGSGTWSSGNTNWTAQTGYGVNGAWTSQVGVFAGPSGGDVTIAGIQAFQELRFETNGYVLAGATVADGLATSGGFSVIDVSSGLDVTVNAPISGAGGLTKTGSGMLGLGGVNSYAGVTNVAAGTLVLLAGGTITGAVVNDAALISTGVLGGGLTNNGSAAIAGQLNGAVSNNGALTLTGATSGIGAFTQSAAGTFALGGYATTIGSLAGTGTVQLGGGLLTTNGNNGSTSFAGTISGGGGVTKLGTGTLTLTGANAFTGLTTISAGTLAVGSTGIVAGAVRNDATLTNAGTIGGLVTNAATLTSTGILAGGLANSGTALVSGQLLGAISNGGTITLGGATIGMGAVTQATGGAFSLNGFNTAIGSLAGAGAVALGTARLTAGGDNNSTSFAGIISGSGGLTKTGTGTLTLTGANSYSGGTLVSGGRLRGDTGSLQGAFQADATLEFAQAVTGTFAGSLSGAGALEKTGAGALAFTGDSSTFTGATRVLAGRLAINGLLSRSTITVGNGGTLGGTGTVGGIVAQSGATIAPGNSVGTLNVSGNVQFQAGSLFAVEIQGNTADRIIATGTAQLGGTLAITDLGGTHAVNSTYVILQAAGGVTGTFNVTTGLGSFGTAVRGKILYTATQVQLQLAPNQISALLGNGTLSFNQASTSNRFDAAVAAGYDPDPLIALYNLTSAQIPGALDALSGEVYATATRVALEDERLTREATLSRLAEAGDLGLTGHGGWGQMVGSWGSADGDGNAAGHDLDRTGFLAGIDTGFATEEGSWRAGFTGHRVRTIVPTEGRGRVELERAGGGIYFGVATDRLRVSAGATLARLDINANRQIAFVGFTDATRGKTRGDMLQTFGEIGFRIGMDGNSFVEPFLTGSVTRIQFDAFRETGGPAALAVRGQKSTLGIAVLGMRGETALKTGKGSGIRVGGGIGLQRAFGDRMGDPIIALAAAPAYGFAVRSTVIDRYSVVGNLDLSLDVSDSLGVRLGYTGMYGSRAREHGARASVILRF